MRTGSATTVRRRRVVVVAGAAAASALFTAGLARAAHLGAPPWTGGVGAAALTLSTKTDGVPGLGALAYFAEPGAPVRRTYLLANRSEAELMHVGLSDPDAPVASLRCASGTGETVALAKLVVPAWGERSCTGWFSAQPGLHRVSIRASASVPDSAARLSATAEAGYDARVGALILHETLSGDGRSAATAVAPTVAQGSTIRARYTLRNGGTVPLRKLTLTDSLPVSALSCLAANEPLPPGTTRTCQAVLRALPGTHRGSALATGTEPAPSIDENGPGPARSVQAVDRAGYTAGSESVSGIAVSAPRGEGAGADGGGRVAQVVQSARTRSSRPSQTSGSSPVSSPSSAAPNQSASSGNARQAARAGGLHPRQRRRHVLGLLLMMLLAVIVPVLAARRSLRS